MKSALKPFPSRRLSKTKFFCWEPTAANKPTIDLATESRSGWEAGREEGRGESGGGEDSEERARRLFFLLFFILQKGCNQHSGTVGQGVWGDGAVAWEKGLLAV